MQCPNCKREFYDINNMLNIESDDMCLSCEKIYYEYFNEEEYEDN